MYIQNCIQLLWLHVMVWSAKAVFNIVFTAQIIQPSTIQAPQATKKKVILNTNRTVDSLDS